MQVNRKLIFWIIGIVLLSILILPRLQFLVSDDSEFTERSERILRVEGVVMETHPITRYFRTSGNVLAYERVDLRPEVSGKITLLNFEEGDWVSEGDLLVKINDAELQAELKRAESQEAIVSRRKQRQEELLEIEAVSRESFENTQNELQSVQADIEHIRARIDKTEIRAPFDGMVGIRHVSPGSFVSADRELATLVMTDPLKIEFGVPERHASQVKKGDTVSFKAEGLDDTLTAKVYALQPYIDQETRNLTVRARYENSESGILPGAFADLEFVVSHDPEGLKVPSEALIPEVDGHQVYVYRDGKSIHRRVEIGMRMDREVQILSGLEAGDTVLTTGILQMRDGGKVEIRELINNQ